MAHHILVAEDEPAIADTILYALRTEGFEVTWSTTGDDLLQHLAFVIAALVSVTMVTAYLYAALRGRFPWKVAALGQAFFLVLFSYSFFLKGMTGLTVAIGSVITLGILMKVTAHINWETAFGKTPPDSKPVGIPPIPVTGSQDLNMKSK